MDLNTKAIEMFMNLISKEPETEQRKYIFITDSSKLWENIIACGYSSIIINNDNLEELQQCIGNAVLKANTHLKYYKLLPVTSTKSINDKIIEVLDRLYLPTNSRAWQIFNTKYKDMNYFEEHPKEVEKAINKFVSRDSDNKNKPLYISGNCYFRNDKNNTQISNFIIEPIELIDNSDMALLKAYFKTENGKSLKKTISTSAFNDVKSFKAAINKDTLELIFKGSGNDLEDIKTLIEEVEYPIRKGVKCIGLHKQSGKYYFVDNDKAISSNGTINENIVFIEEFKGIETDILQCEPITKEELESISGALLGFNEPSKVLPILGFCCCCFLKEFLYESNYKLNHLFLIGESGSGKSTTVENIIQPFFSIKQVSGVADLTPFTMIKNGASSNTIPFILEEYKPSKLHSTLLHKISNFLRNAYDRHTGQRGKANQSVNEYIVLSPVVMVGEAGTEETALIERSIILAFSKMALTSAMGDNIRQLKASKTLISKLGRLVLNTAMETDTEQLRQRHIYYDEFFSKVFKTDRIVNSLSNTMLGIELLVKAYASLKLPFPYNAGEVAEVLIKTVREDTLDNQETPTTAVENIIELMDLMASKKPFLKDYFALINNDTELAIDVKGVYPELLKFIREYNIQDIEILSQKQFTKQLRNTEYFIEYNDVRFNRGKRRKAYKLILLKLNGKIDLTAINDNAFYVVDNDIPLPPEFN